MIVQHVYTANLMFKIRDIKVIYIQMSAYSEYSNGKSS